MNSIKSIASESLFDDFQRSDSVTTGNCSDSGGSSSSLDDMMDHHFDFSSSNIFQPHDNELDVDIFNDRNLESGIGDEDTRADMAMDLLLPEMTDFSKLLEEGELGLEIPPMDFGDGVQPLLMLSTEETTNSNTNSSFSTETETEAEQKLGHDANLTFFEAFSPESPPLTPPEIKVDVDSKPQFILNGTSIISVNGLPKLLPALKSSKRGRSASHDDSPDVQALKRHIRMIRNRESASLSRKKKKEYVTTLEAKISELEKEIQRLQQENKSLKTRLGSNISGESPLNPGSKHRLSAVAKVALFGLCCVLISFHPTTRLHIPPQQSNFSEFSRTFGNIQVTGLGDKNNEKIPLLSTVARSRRWTADDDISERYLNVTSWESLENQNTTSHSEQMPLYSNNTSTSMELHNRTVFEKSRKRTSTPSRLRSRSNKAKKQTLAYSNARSLFNSASLIFPKFGVPFSSNSTKKVTEIQKCPNYFNKTESMRVQNDLEGIFGKVRFTEAKRKRERVQPKKAQEKQKPIVYSLISSNSISAGPNSDPDFNKGLTIYDAGSTPEIKHKGPYSTILEKLERREDTFYVVSLASDSQLLLSAKSANESSRPKMTFLLPWRNETLQEDMILQIDCEVFQVFNLNNNKNQDVKFKTRSPVKN